MGEFFFPLRAVSLCNLALEYISYSFDSNFQYFRLDFLQNGLNLVPNFLPSYYLTFSKIYERFADCQRNALSSKPYHLKWLELERLNFTEMLESFIGDNYFNSSRIIANFLLKFRYFFSRRCKFYYGRRNTTHDNFR